MDEPIDAAPVPPPTDHVPPGGVQLSAVVCPTQVESPPVIAPGSGFTVATALSEHPVGSVYVTLTVPGVMPPSVPPPVLMVPVAVGAAIHVPPAGLPVSVSVEPSHTCNAEPDGEMPVGNPLMSNVTVR